MKSLKFTMALLVFLLVFKNDRVGADGHLRIIGGQKAKIEDHPWIVYLYETSEGYFCGGSLINADTVITAAHCFDSYPPTHIIAGNIDRNNVRDSIEIKNHKLHDYYNNKTYDYDIAILKLAKKVTFSKKIQPIQLPKQDYEVPAGTKVTTAGWGKTEVKIMYNIKV
uniref:Trypsin-like n=1 Tax=Diabrotica virgifera virgifera TaxID=50390 RepID=A0A6P7GZ37_DIAVI